MKPKIMLSLEDAYFMVDTLKSVTHVYSGMLMKDDIGEITRQILLRELSNANKAIDTLEPLIPNNLA